LPSGLTGGDGFHLLAKVLDLRQTTHERVAENIAHQDTPGYKARRLEFEGALRKAAGSGNTLHMKTTQKGHIGQGDGGRFGQVNGTETRVAHGPKSNGNTVNTEEEMATLSQNTLMYNVTSQILANKYRGMRSMIHEGR